MIDTQGDSWEIFATIPFSMNVTILIGQEVLLVVHTGCNTDLMLACRHKTHLSRLTFLKVGNSLEAMTS